MTKIQVAWRGFTKEYIGVGDTLQTKSSGGVQEFECWKSEKIEEWLGNMSVQFGEEGGRFQVAGFWYGEFEDLKNGKDYLKPSSLFYLTQRAQLECLEDDKEMNQALEIQGVQQ